MIGCLGATLHTFPDSLDLKPCFHVLSYIKSEKWGLEAEKSRIRVQKAALVICYFFIIMLYGTRIVQLRCFL